MIKSIPIHSKIDRLYSLYLNIIHQPVFSKLLIMAHTTIPPILFSFFINLQENRGNCSVERPGFCQNLIQSLVEIDRRSHADPIEGIRPDKPTRIGVVGPNRPIGPQIIEDRLPPFQNHVGRHWILLIQVDAGVAPRNLRELVKGTKRGVVVEEGGIEPSCQIGYKNDNHVVNMDSE
jgi:hypothetical protein